MFDQIQVNVFFVRLSCYIKLSCSVYFCGLETLGSPSVCKMLLLHFFLRLVDSKGERFIRSEEKPEYGLQTMYDIPEAGLIPCHKMCSLKPQKHILLQFSMSEIHMNVQQDYIPPTGSYGEFYLSFQSSGGSSFS